LPSELIAYCGLYCGACSFRMASKENNRKHIENMPSIYDNLKNDPLEYCPGCRLENKCGECKIRDCAIENNHDHCGECSDFPCDKITKFNNDGKPHHSEVLSNLILLNEIGEKNWLEHMDEKWSCKCGAKLSWYYKSCSCSN